MPEKENVNTEYASKNEEQEDQAIRETGSLKLTGKNGKHGEQERAAEAHLPCGHPP